MQTNIKNVIEEAFNYAIENSIENASETPLKNAIEDTIDDAIDDAFLILYWLADRQKKNNRRMYRKINNSLKSTKSTNPWLNAGLQIM